MDFRARIVSWLAGKTNLPEEQIDGWIEIPPQEELGDFAFPCFRLAKVLRKAPPQIAADLASQAESGLAGMDKVQAVNGYLNFFINRSLFISQTVATTLSAGDQLGRSQEGQGQTVIIEYSSPNIAKPFHVGHAFTTILGNALYKL